MIFPWIMLTAAVIFGYLAYDAVPAKDFPYSLTAKGWLKTSHMSRSRSKRSENNTTPSAASINLSGSSASSA